MGNEDKQGVESSVGRRSVLIGAGTLGMTALLAACGGGDGNKSEKVAVPSDVETKTAKLGFIALTDAAPLIMAKELGLFAKYGMPDVQVAKQANWAATRDNLALGSGAGGVDGAHILTPMPYFLTLGSNGKPTPISILARLNTNGQGISVEKAYLAAKADLDAAKMKAIIADKKAGGSKITMAMTFPGGTHDLWIRYWLAAAGINPESDVELITIPPPQMVANMKAKTMEAFCVGEPWNAQLVAQNIGYTAVSTGQLWQDHPEKSFAMRSDWIEKHPKAAVALTAAIIEAQQWCDKRENIDKMAETIGGRDYLKVPPADIKDRLAGLFKMGDGREIKDAPFRMKFWADNASFPFKSHDMWFLVENQRWGKLPADLDRTAVIAKVNRADIWRKAAALAGVAEADIPTDDSRGQEKFFDGKVFDPGNPAAYLESLAIKKA
ncbi:MAG: ABC transporter substrate-binding protein [Sphingomonadaceae bacterium]|nr:ABC transporter substrate-binding protein [Sphingomonadaceae bacterium]